MMCFNKILFATMAFGLVLGVQACGDKTPPAAAGTVAERPSDPIQATSKADLAGVDGLPASVVGTLKRKDPNGGSTGTAIILSDGTAIYVSAGEPPDGWDWMLDENIRVQGTLYAQVPEGTFGDWAVAGLLQTGSPMPGDVGMPGMKF